MNFQVLLFYGSNKLVIKGVCKVGGGGGRAGGLIVNIFFGG